MAQVLTPRDKTLAAAFAVVWLFAMAMRVNSFGVGLPYWTYVNVLGDGYPVVQGFTTPQAAEETQLLIGDRVLRIGESDLRGKGQLAYMTTIASEGWEAGGVVPFVVDRAGTELQFDEVGGGYPRSFRTGLIIALIWGSVALIIFLRATPSVTTHALFWLMGSHALMYTGSFSGPGIIFGISLVIALVATTVAQPLMLRGYLTFPEEANALHGFNHVWPWFFAPVGLLLFSSATAVPLRPEVARPLAAVSVVLFILTSIAILTRNFIRSDPIGRRKMKWVMFQLYLGGLVAFTVYAIIGVTPTTATPLWADLGILYGSAGFPISILIAVLKFDLFDIDRILGATVSYNILAIAVVGLGFLALPPLTEALVEGLGVAPALASSGGAMFLAAGFVAANRRVRPQVDRLFFKERFALARAMESLPVGLSSASSPEELWSMTGSELVTHVRPTGCVIFTSTGDAFVPTFVDGDMVPSTLPADAQLVQRLSDLETAVLCDRKFMRGLDPLGRAVLENLEAKLLVPVHRSGTLEAFVCLGEKRSGDIFTQTDLTLITSLAKSLSIHLLRFSEADLLERALDIQGKMRRYVPGAVAELIAEGEIMETGEREVSVLFVDIRGYTQYSHGRDVAETFSLVNRYTELVSTIVQESGGAVVEFNGDGMMAVFGAPRRLDEKERAAVMAARRLVEDVPLLESDHSAGGLAVGVGVATGPAFVGNIEAVDRVIWSAIGSTTNFAARLQSLTRDMGMSILIDAHTQSRASSESEGFVQLDGVEVRGRDGESTVFGLAQHEDAST